MYITHIKTYTICNCLFSFYILSIFLCLIAKIWNASSYISIRIKSKDMAQKGASTNRNQRHWAWEALSEKHTHTSDLSWKTGKFSWDVSTTWCNFL